MMIYSSTARFLTVTLAVASQGIFSVDAQTQTQKLSPEQFIGNFASNSAPPGYNLNGGYVMTNFLDAFNNKQFFIHNVGKFIFEMPYLTESVPNDFVFWCSNLAFSDFQNNSSYIGFVGRCIIAILLVSHNEEELFENSLYAHEVGDWQDRYENTFDFHGTTGVSCVYVQQINVFECELHDNALSWQARFWDDGQETMSEIGWEAHSEKDGEVTWAWSGVGQLKWMSANETAAILNTTPAELNTDTFASMYEKVWAKEYNVTMADGDDGTTNSNSTTNDDDNNTEADANNTSDTSAAAGEDDAATEEDDAAEATDTVDDSNGSGRKLASATNRVVSTVLSLFGI